jgi:hypothetical protein
MLAEERRKKKETTAAVKLLEIQVYGSGSFFDAKAEGQFALVTNSLPLAPSDIDLEGSCITSMRHGCGKCPVVVCPVPVGMLSGGYSEIVAVCQVLLRAPAISMLLRAHVEQRSCVPPCVQCLLAQIGGSLGDMELQSAREFRVAVARGLSRESSRDLVQILFLLLPRVQGILIWVFA